LLLLFFFSFFLSFFPWTMNLSTADLRNFMTEFHETWWSYRYMFLVGPKVFSFHKKINLKKTERYIFLIVSPFSYVQTTKKANILKNMIKFCKLFWV
jgi:hypothetical protein